MKFHGDKGQRISAMEFKIVNTEDVSMLMRPSDVGVKPFKSFIAGRDPEPIFAQPLPPEEGMRGIRRNLQSEFENDDTEEESVILPPPSSKETVKVFLRIKPKTEEESHYYSVASQDADSTLGASQEASIPDPKDDNSIVSLESDHQLAITAPPDSAAYKNSVNGKGKLTHRFTFTKIFAQSTEQSDIFGQIVKPRLQDFVEGRSQLLFTYGATCSGKTFTIQGDSSRPGILPRALDVLFNSIKNNHIDPESISIKPQGYSRVASQTARQREQAIQEKKTIIEMGASLAQFMDNTDQFSDDSQTSIASLRSRQKDDSTIDLGQTSLSFGIWVSFAEIYNENIYDLFEKMPEVKNKGDKPRRPPLKLADDKGGWAYIKGLREVSVSSADEAYQLLLIGRKNVQFAATRLNHHSSRSHCIFTIKMVRVADIQQPHLARVSMLSFCDLAGSERIKKTLNTGERQREAGNINTSLLVLGRCIKALRHNQPIKDPKKHQIVPFRDSKLTRLFQSYFTGSGKVSMIVNISQSPYLFDESLQVLKFSAIASKVHVKLIKEPAPVILKKAAEKAKRQTRFSILVENNKKSLCRGSIAWENPQFRSTICPKGMESTVLEEDETEFADETHVADETVIDSKFDGLLKVIENLKNQLIEEKQKNIKLESEIRTELCDEFNKMMVDIETSWEQRLQEEKDRASELSDWRISKLEEALREKRQRSRLSSTSQRNEEQYEADIKEKGQEIEHLKEELEAIKTLHSSTLGSMKKQEENAKQNKEQLDACEILKTESEQKLADALKKLESSNEAIKMQNSDPRIAELESNVKELTEKRAEDSEQISNLNNLLDEASQDYLSKNEEIESLKGVITNFKVSCHIFHKYNI